MNTPQNQPKSHTNSLRIKPKIFFQEAWRCYNKLDMVDASKLRSKMLQKISISPIITNKFDRDKIQRLRQALQNTKSVHTLHLKLNKCSQDALELIALELKSLNRLRDLSLDFSGCNKVFPKELLTLFSSLKESVYLNRLHLNFNESSLNVRLIAQLLSAALRNQRNLRNLVISAQMISNGTWTEMINFMKSLRRCSRTLETLSLDFSRCQNIATQVLGCMLLNLKAFKSLVHFNLDLAGCQIFDPLPVEKGLDSFYSMNKNLKRLKLGLGLSTYSSPFEILIIQLKDYKALEAIELTLPSKAYKMLRLFSKNIKGLKSLKTLKVDFVLLDETPEMDEIMPEFVLALQSLENLKTLDLRFGEYNLNPKVANIILEAIKTLKDLRSLTLDWNFNSTINDKNAENLGTCLRGFEKLTSLSLGLQGCDITKTGVIAIFKGLENLKELKYVDFNPSYPISESGSWFKNLFKRTREIMPANSLGTEISNLTLDFFGFQLSGNELHQIALNLRKMRAMRHLSLSLDFLNSDAQWRTGFSSIMTVLNELPRLSSLSIGLDNFGNEDLESLFIDIEGMKELRSLSVSLHKGEVLDIYAAKMFWEAMRGLWRLKEFRLKLYLQNSFRAESVRFLLLGLWELRCLESLTFDLLLSIDYLAVQGYSEVEAVEKKVLKHLKSLKTLRFLRYMDETMIS